MNQGRRVTVSRFSTISQYYWFQMCQVLNRKNASDCGRCPQKQRKDRKSRKAIPTEACMKSARMLEWDIIAETNRTDHHKCHADFLLFILSFVGASCSDTLPSHHSQILPKAQRLWVTLRSPIRFLAVGFIRVCTGCRVKSCIYN